MLHKSVTGGAVMLAVAAFLVSAPASVAWAAETQAADTPEAHAAKGEVKYGTTWVSIDTLFKDYLTGRTELQGLNAKIDDARAKLMEIQRRLSQMKTDAAAADRPARAELAKARNKQREYQRALDAKPPVKPVLQPLPPQPRQPVSRRSSRSGRSGSGYSDYDDPADQQYDNALQAWQNRCDIIKRQNDAAIQKYNQALTEYKQNLTQAQKEMPKVEAIVKASDAKLEQSAKELESKAAPVLDDVKKANEGVLTIQAQVAAVETRLKNMADAIRSAPETLQYQYGIVEWEGMFYLTAELEKLYADTQAQINSIHDKLKEETVKAGQPFPATWRHPQQDRMDALKALLDKVKAASTTAKAAA